MRSSFHHALIVAALGASAFHARAQIPDFPRLSWLVAPSPADARSVERITAFHAVWGAAWRRSEATRHSLDDRWGYSVPLPNDHMASDDYYRAGGERRRVNMPYSNARCWGDYGLPEPGFDSLRSHLRHRWLVSTYNRFGVCPSWFTEHVRRPGDERIELDQALVESERAAVRHQRAALLAGLDSALAAGAPSAFLRGQVVRFAVDQGDTAQALAAVASCAAAGDWWCHFLRGYARASAGALGAAESAFATAIALAPPDLRCRLEDVGFLTDERGGGRDAPPSCFPARDTATAWAWALADPLWSEPVNQRRVEHYVRHAQVILRGSLPRDERHSWVEREGNDARRAMVLRYGWPSYVLWNGPKTDSTRVGFPGRDANAPYTGYQYFPGRVHLMPHAIALQDPFSWESSRRAMIAPPSHDSRDPNAPLWFPVEHMAAPFPLVQQPAGQTAMLQRQDSVLLAVAVTLDAALLRRSAAAPVLNVQLWVAQTPYKVQPLADEAGRAGQDVVLMSPMVAAPTVLSVEVPAELGRPALRARYGVRPPPPLHTMPPGATAVSTPVLLHVGVGTSALASDPQQALRRMRGTLALPRGERLGVYWETYGLAPTDTVTHAVWLQRVTTPGRLARVGQALGLGRGRNTPVAIEWTETRLGPTATDLGGPVRIIGRTLVLDVGALPAGEYVLTVEARRPGQAPVRDSQTLRVE